MSNKRRTGTQGFTGSLLRLVFGDPPRASEAFGLGSRNGCQALSYRLTGSEEPGTMFLCPLLKAFRQILAAKYSQVHSETGSSFIGHPLSRTDTVIGLGSGTDGARAMHTKRLPELLGSSTPT